MKSSGVQALNRQKALDNYVQEESIRLKNQIADLEIQLTERDQMINSQASTINQLQRQLSSLQNSLSSKTNENAMLQKELLPVKKSITDLEQSLKQKDNIIELMSKSFDEVRLEKHELKEKLDVYKNRIKERDFQLSLIQKPISEFDKSNIDIDKIFDPFKENQTIKSEYTYIDQKESNLIGDISDFNIIESD